MMNTDRGTCLNSELFGSLNPAMACKDSTRFINKNGAQKPKILDTFLELRNLTLAVYTRGFLGSVFRSSIEIRVMVAGRVDSERGREPAPLGV